MSNYEAGVVGSLDSIYFLSCIFLLFIIYSDRNLLDMLYLVVITVYYIRLRIYRKNHNV